MYEQIKHSDLTFEPSCAHCGWLPFITALIALYALLATALLVIPNPTTGDKDTNSMEFSTSDSGTKHAFNRDRTGDDQGGFSAGPGFHIRWSPEDHRLDSHASTGQVLEATLARMEFIQSTPQANHQNAQALWHVMQARDVIAGQQINQNPPLNGVKP